MAQTLYLSDGSREVLFYSSDDIDNRIAEFERILREHLGNDVAAYFRDIVAEVKNSTVENSQIENDF